MCFRPSSGYSVEFTCVKITLDMEGAQGYNFVGL